MLMRNNDQVRLLVRSNLNGINVDSQVKTAFGLQDTVLAFGSHSNSDCLRVQQGAGKVVAVK